MNDDDEWLPTNANERLRAVVYSVKRTRFYGGCGDGAQLLSDRVQKNCFWATFQKPATKYLSRKPRHKSSRTDVIAQRNSVQLNFVWRWAFLTMAKTAHVVHWNRFALFVLWGRSPSCPPPNSQLPLVYYSKRPASVVYIYIYIFFFMYIFYLCILRCVCYFYGFNTPSGVHSLPSWMLIPASILTDTVELVTSKPLRKKMPWAKLLEQLRLLIERQIIIGQNRRIDEWMNERQTERTNQRQRGRRFENKPRQLSSDGNNPQSVVRMLIWLTDRQKRKYSFISAS